MLQIKEVLLCKPSYFEVNYVINPWMKPGTVNKHLAMVQWNKLLKTLIKLKIKVNIIDQKKGFPDMVFAADQAIFKDGIGVLSNFRFNERKGETNYYKKWFKNKKIKLNILPKNVYFEGGGESIWHTDNLLVGTGFRNSKNIKKHLSGIFNKKVYEIELINPYFYHLDTCLFSLNDFIFYYPPAISEKSKRVLKKLSSKLIPITKKEVFNFAANSLSIGNFVITQKGNPKLIQKIKNLGFKPIELDLGEFMKAGGGIHCLIQPLQ